MDANKVVDDIIKDMDGKPKLVGRSRPHTMGRNRKLYKLVEKGAILVEGAVNSGETRQVMGDGFNVVCSNELTSPIKVIVQQL